MTPMCRKQKLIQGFWTSANGKADLEISSLNYRLVPKAVTGAARMAIFWSDCMRLLDEAAIAEKKQEFIVLLNPNHIFEKHLNVWQSIKIWPMARCNDQIHGISEHLCNCLNYRVIPTATRIKKRYFHIARILPLSGLSNKRFRLWFAPLTQSNLIR